MNRKIPKSLKIGLIAVMTLLILALFVEIRRCPNLPRRLMLGLLLQRYSPGPAIEFKWQMSASGATPDGGRFDSTQYMSSDCVGIFVTYSTFSSAATAKERLDSSIAIASSVHAKSGHPGADTNLADQRIILSSQPKGTYEILRRNGNRILRIESSSLNHALEYERRMVIQAPAGAR